MRAYCAGDGPAYYAMSLRNRDHLQPYEAHNPARTLDSAEAAEILVRQFAAAYIAREHFFMGAWEKNGDFAAQLFIGALNWDLPEFIIGYFVDVDHEGQGFVTEMVQDALPFLFTHFGAHRIALRCNDGNLRSASVAERCGFTREGHLRETHRNPDGSFSGDYYYALLRADFQARRADFEAQRK